MKPMIFIGSSSEGLEVARAIKQQLENDAIVDIWNEGIFEINRSYLETLNKVAYLYDYSILVLSPDDEGISRGVASKIPRDNVIFEHGLFLGRLGLNKAFIVCDESVKILSDYTGITILRYQVRENLVSAVGSVCNTIRYKIKDFYDSSEITPLPSTSLAIGYFNNFIHKVYEALSTDQLKLKKETNVIEYDDFKLTILIPDSMSDITPINLSARQLKKKTNKELVQVTLASKFRDFPFFLELDKNSQIQETIELIDIPTTLLASREAIKLIFGEKIKRDLDIERLEQREIQNFENTLRYLIEKNFGKSNVDIEIRRFSEISNT